MPAKMSNSTFTVSVVIPTRNRKESLLRTISSLAKQIYVSSEIIVVDSSDKPVNEIELKKVYPEGNFKILSALPSVCAQRNIGIRASLANFVLLLDDDIEIEENYLQKIEDFIDVHPEAKALSGLVLEKNAEHKWNYTFPKSTFLSLLWCRIFQLGIWAETSVSTNDSWLLRRIKNYFNKRGNTVSKAGWPVLTNFNEPFFRSQIYGLGASVIQKNWLLNHLYDEKLDTNGIGDNYGVAMHLTLEEGVFILTDIHAFHHKEQSNRPKNHNAYYSRVKALHYFISKNKKVTKATSAWLVWSLMGNFISSVCKLNFKLGWANLCLIKMIISGNNSLMKS